MLLLLLLLLLLAALLQIQIYLLKDGGYNRKVLYSKQQRKQAFDFLLGFALEGQSNDHV